jgi:outer membrane protein OmpA-like peptidoglycan-associated protein
MNILKLFSLLILSVCSNSVIGQSLSTKNKKAQELYFEADNYRVRGQFKEAISFLNEAISKDKNFEEAYYRLGIIYKAQENYPLASTTFEQGLFLVKEDVRRKMYLYELANVNLRHPNYKAASAFSIQFLQVEKSDKRKIDLVKVWKSQADYALANQVDLPYRITPLSDTVNAFPMQYFPALTADNTQLIFTARFGGSRNDNEDLLVSRKENGRWMAPVSISPNINTIQREGACTISADGRHLILTICGSFGCDLFETRKTGNVWSQPKNLGPTINSANWDSQPSLSADGRELYFVSDRKGGVGGYDIWYSQLSETGWSKAKNLGPEINTQFDEISPYIHVNNQTLYIVSNGYPGYGGYDIYVSEKKEIGWTIPEDMGKPLNDHKDQYSFMVASDGALAYYSREESKNRSRLYRIDLPEDKIVKSRGNVVQGKVSDSKANPLKANVELFDLKLNKKIAVVNSDSVSGEYVMVLPGGSEYALYVRKRGYLFHSLHFNYEEEVRSEPVVKNIALVSLQQNASVVLNNLFFDLNKYELKPQSETELKEVIDFLNQNPELKIEIGGHTDNSGTEIYNQQLSEKRANAVAEFLKNQQISSTQVVTKGYGSKSPLKPNDSEENRQLNRRIEFKIVGQK